jgi:hypothetical protein
MKTIAYKAIGNIDLVVTGQSAPTDKEWNEYVKHLSPMKPEDVRSLVFTEGGGPNAGQRKQLTEWLGPGSTVAAIVTTSAVMRGIITALSWFNPKVRIYAPSATIEAFEYLQIPESQYDIIVREARKLGLSLGTGKLKCLDFDLYAKR